MQCSCSCSVLECCIKDCLLQSPELFRKVLLDPLIVVAVLGAARHPQRRHLRLLVEVEQPETRGQRHADAEEDEEHGEPGDQSEVSMAVSRDPLSTNHSSPGHHRAVPVEILLQTVHRPMSAQQEGYSSLYESNEL